MGSLKDKSISITILKWEKFNPRHDVKHSSWFRLGHGLFEDHEFYDFSHDELCFWIYLLCLASKKNSANVLVSLAHARNIGRFKEKTIFSTIQKLEDLNIASRERNARDTDTIRVRALRDETGRNETRRDVTSFDFDLVYEKYPRKEGKAAAIKVLASTIKTETDFANLEIAVANYARKCDLEKTEPRFIKQFSSFVGPASAPNWHEWISWAPTGSNGLSFEERVKIAEKAGII